MTNEAHQQQQFLDVIDRDEAERRFRAALDLRPLEPEIVPLSAALGRVLADDVIAPLDVPSFDRSNVDGFAVQAADTFGASEDRPRTLMLNPETLATGMAPRTPVAAGTATAIATGAMLPRGADAVVMIEHTNVLSQDKETERQGDRETRRQGDRETGRQGDRETKKSDPVPLPVYLSPCLLVSRPVAPGANITFAGTDIGQGEVVLRRGEHLTSRETGVLAALGSAEVAVVRKPRVAIVSTGDELIPPGTPMRPGLVHDSNATVLADAVRELGGEPIALGIVADDRERLLDVLGRALVHDAILLSGGTSKGAGDVSYRAVAELGKPGIVAHGVALKPGKPLCLAVINPDQETTRRPVPVVVLPGFPTSAIFTFHEFIAPVLRLLAGRRDEPTGTVSARLPLRVNSERGRTEYLLVHLVEGPENPSPTLIAYPMGKGSGSVTAFSRADGFVVIPRQREYLEAGSVVAVRLLGAGVTPADFVVIGSHCTGLDYLLGELHGRGYASKLLAVGSTGGLEAAKRGECDVAGIHLLDPKTDVYNRPFLTDSVELVPGYGRLQGIVFRPGDARFEHRSVADAVALAVGDPNCVLVNRNRGSGTRILIDRLLDAARPPGYLTEARSHNAVAAAVVQGRADWGVAIEPVARAAGLGFLPLQEEQYDFVIPKARRQRSAVRAFVELLSDARIRAELARRGFRPNGLEA